MSKQLWKVEVAIETVVYAETSEDAKRIAHANLWEIAADYFTEDWYATPLRLLPWKWEASAKPYGADDGQTIARILEAEEDAEDGPEE